MSFLSGLGNIFHSIGSFFSGGDDEDQKKKQQQYQPPHPTAAPQQFLAPTGGPVFHQPGQPDQPQQYQPQIKLVQDNGQTDLQKANPQPAPQQPQQQAAPAPKPHASIWHDITHNPVTDAIGSGLVKPAAQFGNALIHVPQAVYREVQNKPIDDIQKTVFGTTDSGQIAKDILGDTATLGLTAVAPGLDNLAEKGLQAGVDRFLPNATEAIGSNLVKYGSKAATGAGLNTALGTVQGVQAGLSPEELIKAVPKEAGMGAALGVAFPAVFGGLKKFTGNLQRAVAGDPNVPDLHELDTGVESVNPTQVQDAAKAHAANTPPEVPPAEPAVPTPSGPAEATPAPQPVTTPAVEQQALQLEQPAANPQPAAETPQPQAATAPAEPTVQPNAVGATAPAAPLTHDTLVKQLGENFKGLKGKAPERDAAVIQDMKNKAAATIANMSDEDLLKSFNTVTPEHMITDPNSVALARAALDRFAKVSPDSPEFPVASASIENILNAIDKNVSKSALVMRFIQEDFDQLPLPMKVRYIVNKIDNAWKGNENYTPLKDDPAKAQAVEQAITNYLTSSQNIADRIAKLQGELNDIAENPTKAAGVDPKAINAQIQSAELQLRANNGELVKFYEDQVPKGAKSRRFNDFARNMMLGSFSGRINDLLTTGNNIVHLQAQNVTQGLLAKAINHFKPGLVSDTLKGGSQLFKADGAKEAVGGFRGKQYVDDVRGAIQSNQLQRANLKRSQGVFGRTVQAATDATTKLTTGVKNQRLYQLADQEAMQKGYTGEARKIYAEARMGAPSADMEARSHELKMQMNNLNNNPISSRLNRFAASIDSDKGGAGALFGGMLRNQIIPFTSWLGGNMWNSITDKNVVATFTKMAMAAAKGDAEGFVHNLAGTVNNAAATYALGYLLSKNGMLVHSNPEGYNDDGLYLRLGNRSIPVTFLGFFAPSMILGNAAYEGINSSGNVVDKFGKSLESGISSAVRAYGIPQALGADNNVSRVVQLMQQQGSKVTPADAGATALGNWTSEYIPAITRDINSFLDQTGLNPTHERADTKAMKTNTTVTANGTKTTQSKDYPASALRQVQSDIPILSQKLPRKTGVAAKDFIDRVDKGDRYTAEQNQKAATKAATANQEKQDIANDVPNPADANFKNAVEARVERGEYGKVIAAYRQQLKSVQNDKNTPQSTKDEISAKIKQFQVAKDNKLSFADMQLYNSTNLTEWRSMDNPKSEKYDPETYQKLWNIDEALAKAGVAGTFGIKGVTSFSASDKQKYSAKAASSGSGSGSRSRYSKANGYGNDQIGSLPELKNVTFGNLVPRKTSTPIPVLQKIPASQLIKKRAITVVKA